MSAWSDATALVRGRAGEDAAGGPRDPYAASAPPLYQTATFRQPSSAVEGPYDYSRSGNPTRDGLEAELARLERSRHAFAYASGLAAVAAALRVGVRTPRNGEGAATPSSPGPPEILASDDLYGGSYRFLVRQLADEGVGVRFADFTDEAAVAAAIGPSTRLLLAENPTNPRLRVVDLRALARLAHAAGARLAVDGSLLTPLRQRPLALGADLVIHSATKALGGHSDLTAGVVATDDDALAERLAFARNAEGTALAPFEAWLLRRGLRTLALRVERQEATARRIAEALAGEPRVTRLHAPSLASHPGHALLARQATGCGPVISFETGDVRLSTRLLDALELFPIAVSFGGVASSASLPCRLSHASVPEAVRRERALPEDLVRLSVGIEEADDLLVDLARAFAALRNRLPRTSAATRGLPPRDVDPASVGAPAPAG